MTTSDQALVPVDPRDIALADPDEARAALAHLSATGDVSRMTNDQRAAFILYYCASVGLNPATGPVQIIEFYDPEAKAKVAKVYVKALAAQQLGNRHRIRIETLSEDMVGKGLFKVAVRGYQPDGRTYDEVGYVSLTDRNGDPLPPDRYKNALMRCHTIAKRRLVLGMIGLDSPPESGDAVGVRRRYLGPHAELLDAPTEEDRVLNDDPRMATAMNRPRFEVLASSTETRLEGSPDQRPRPEVIDPPARTIPRQSFRPSEEDVKRHLGAWFATVDGTSLDDDDARHRYVAGWTQQEGWPKAKQTDSLRTAFGRMTERESSDFLAHVRAIAEDERAANREALADSNRDEAAAEADEVPF